MQTSEPIVFVCQVPNRRDKQTNTMVPSFNLGPAAVFGKVELLLPPNASFFATADLLHTLRKKLRDYEYDRGDSILASGDPAIIAATGSVLCELTHNYRLLKWEKSVGRYISVDVKLR